MTEQAQNTIQHDRIYFLDNLRTFMVFLVVLIHAGLVYEKGVFSAFFWIVYDPWASDVVRVVRIILDIFVMATLFFISGYLTPLSLKKRNGWTFLRSKFKRLMIPWVVAVLTLIPLYKFIFLYSRDLPQQSWTTYFHWSNGVWSQNWLWFLPVLFLFDILYVLLSRIKIDLSALTLKKAVGIVFFIGLAYSVCMDLFKVQGWTKTIVIDFQNERLLIYFMIFLLGSLCYKRAIFESKPESKKLYIIVLCTAWIPIGLYYFFTIKSFTILGHFIFSETVDTLLLWFSFHLSLVCLLYITINTFRTYLDKQGRISQTLNKQSYSVYIIHMIVMGALAMALRNAAIPSLLKFFILTISTFVICNLFIYIYREIIRTKIVKKI